MDKMQWAAEFFKADHFAMQTTGIEILAADTHYAKCGLALTADHMNAAGSVMGGAIFTLADFTFAVASNAPGSPVVSVSSEISYISKATGGHLTAEAKCLKHGKTTCFYLVEVTGDDGNLVANITVTGAVIVV